MAKQARKTQRRKDPHSGCTWTRVEGSWRRKFRGMIAQPVVCKHGEVRYWIAEQK